MSNNKRTLIHICCAECFAKTLAAFRVDGESDFYGYFYNPNIHPLLEFRRRIKALKVYLERDRVPCEINEEYGLVSFCDAVHPQYQSPKRCRACYDIRLNAAAKKAAELGFDIFTTTLTTSRHQDHDLIRISGEVAAARHGVEFLYRDLREAEAPEKLIKGLYRQQYCGCIFSEEERFRNTSQHLYKGP